MTNEQLQDKISKKVQQDIESGIRVLKASIKKSLNEFLVGASNSWTSEFTDTDKAILTILASDHPSKGWPSICWETRKKELWDNVLSTMDTLQKILVAKDTEQEIFPKE